MFRTTFACARFSCHDRALARHREVVHEEAPVPLRAPDRSPGASPAVALPAPAVHLAIWNPLSSFPDALLPIRPKCDSRDCDADATAWHDCPECFHRNFRRLRTTFACESGACRARAIARHRAFEHFETTAAAPVPGDAPPSDPELWTAVIPEGESSPMCQVRSCPLPAAFQRRCPSCSARLNVCSIGSHGVNARVEHGVRCILITARGLAPRTLGPCNHEGCTDKADRLTECPIHRCGKRFESCPEHTEAVLQAHYATHPLCINCERPGLNVDTLDCPVVDCGRRPPGPVCGSACIIVYHNAHHGGRGRSCGYAGCSKWAICTRKCRVPGCGEIVYGCNPSHADASIGAHWICAHPPVCIRAGCTRVADSGGARPCPVIGCNSIPPPRMTCDAIECGIHAHVSGAHRNGLACGLPACTKWAVRSRRCAIAPRGSGPCGELSAACSDEHLALLEKLHREEHKKNDGQVKLSYKRKMIDELVEKAGYPLQDVLLALATLAHEGRAKEGTEGIVRELSIYAEQRRALGAAGPPPLAVPPAPATPRCIACEDAPKNAVFIGCWHVAVCMRCADKARGRCPVCRKETRHERVFGIE